MRRNQTSSFKICGYTRYVVSAPSFALPIFEDRLGKLFVQEVDDSSGLVSALIPADLGSGELEPIDAQATVGIGDQPIYCLLPSNDTIEVGTLGKLKTALEEIISDESAPPGLKVQAAELVGSSLQRRETRKNLAKILMEAGSAVAYQRSATRTFLWRRLINAARDADAVAEIKYGLSHLDVEIAPNGRITLRLGDFDKNLCPSIDFDKLSTELEVELGFSSPSNDDEEVISKSEETEITNERLNWYLNRRFGSDGRIADHTYRFLKDVVVGIGFTSIEQLDRALLGINSAKLCYVAYGNLQGQATRLELSLLAAMPDRYISKHPWSVSPWFRSNQERTLQRMISNGVDVRTFDIEADKSGAHLEVSESRTPPPFELEP